jgi:hypothetical protein
MADAKGRSVNVRKPTSCFQSVGFESHVEILGAELSGSVFESELWFNIGARVNMEPRMK